MPEPRVSEASVDAVPPLILMTVPPSVRLPPVVKLPDESYAAMVEAVPLVDEFTEIVELVTPLNEPELRPAPNVSDWRPRFAGVMPRFRRDVAGSCKSNRFRPRWSIEL